MTILDVRGPAVGTGARSRLAGVSTPDRHVVHGRTVLNRAAICATYGVAVSTAERWWRERATNGHPPVAYREGRRQWWDEQAMRAFIDTGRGEPDQLTHESRVLLGRAALARRYGVSEQYLTDLYHRRTDNGHPEPVTRQGRRLYWDPDLMDSWWEQRQAAQRAALTPVDRSGDPDELLGLTAAAAVLGYEDAGTLRAYISRDGREDHPYFPEPDAVDEAGRRRYTRRTLWQFADRRSRPGRAGHPRPAR